MVALQVLFRQQKWSLQEFQSGLVVEDICFEVMR
jgi:hypothetical protein